MNIIKRIKFLLRLKKEIKLLNVDLLNGWVEYTYSDRLYYLLNPTEKYIPPRKEVIEGVNNAYITYLNTAIEIYSTAMKIEVNRGNAEEKKGNKEGRIDYKYLQELESNVHYVQKKLKKLNTIKEENK